MVSLSLVVKGQAIPIDKQKHFAAGLIIGSMSASDYKAKYPFWNAVLFSSAAGVGKEFMDIGSGVPEAKDIYFTVAGGIVGGGITYWIRTKLNGKYKIIRKRKRIKRRLR